MATSNPLTNGKRYVSKEDASHILLIVREPHLRAALEDALNQRYCICRSAAGSADALRQLKKVPCDIIITDPASGVDEDLALVAEVRTIRPGLRVIVLAPESTPEEIIARGCGGTRSVWYRSAFRSS